jgi:hypothetical protein
MKFHLLKYSVLIIVFFTIKDNNHLESEILKYQNGVSRIYKLAFDLIARPK